MIEGIYSGAASLSALERWQEVISQNLASSSAAGFKKADFFVEGVRGSKNVAAGDSAFPVDSTSVAPRTRTSVDFAPGDLRQTGKDTDFAVDGPGFFQVRKPDGENVYTRDGEFHINSENTLVTKQGYTVIGEDGPVVVDPELGRVSLGEDGSLSQGDNVIGKLSLRDFADSSALQRLDNGFFSPPRGVTPSIVEKPNIVQGSVEASNVSPMSEMVNLVTVSRAYEAAQKMITSHDDLMRQAIQTLGGTTQA